MQEYALLGQSSTSGDSTNRDDAALRFRLFGSTLGHGKKVNCFKQCLKQRRLKRL
jgi:hypothetical protein